MRKRIKMGATAALAGVMALHSSNLGAQHAAPLEIEAQVPNGPLRGSALVPDTLRAAAVIIPGSGPTNRDGDSPLGVNAGYLRMLAEALAQSGVASIRVDKRGMFGSTGDFGDANAVTFDDYAADARAWIDVAKGETGQDCVWLIGHSEGGLVSLVAAQDAGPSLCGVVLVAAPGRQMADVLRAQLRANPANRPILNDALAAIERLDRGERVDVSRYHPALQQLFAPALQGFLIDGFSRDPAALIAALDVPVLVVEGDSDLQIEPEDAQALADAQPAAERVTIAGMNHVLKAAPGGDMAANLATYSDPDRPLAEGLADAIAEFITKER